MGFGVALGLGDLHDGFPADPGAGVLAADGATVGVHLLEHPSRTDVGIVWNRQEVRAEALGDPVEPLPQFFRPFAVEGGVGHKLPRHVGAFAHQHHAVDAGAAREAGPLPTDQGGEDARVIVPVGGLDDALPGGTDDRFQVDVLKGFLAVHGLGHFHKHQPFLARAAAHFQQASARWRVCHAFVPAEQGRGDTEVFRVIRDDEKVQRPRQLDAPAESGVDGRQSLGEAVSHFRTRGSVLHGVGVVGIGAVNVRVAEVHLGGFLGLGQGGGRQGTEHNPGRVKRGMKRTVNVQSPAKYRETSFNHYCNTMIIKDNKSIQPH